MVDNGSSDESSENGEPSPDNEDYNAKKPFAKKVKKDWNEFELKVKGLKDKINRNILKNIEKWEDLKYKNKVKANELKRKIEADWEDMTTDVQYAIQRAKETGENKKQAMAENLKAKKEEIDTKLKSWKETQKQKFKETRKRWERRSWIFFIKFLIVVIPIVIIIVVLANAFS